MQPLMNFFYFSWSKQNIHNILKIKLMSNTDNKPEEKKIEKDIIISIKNLPPAAYDAMSDLAQTVTADLMRRMAQIGHLLTPESKISTSYQSSQQADKE